MSGVSAHHFTAGAEADSAVQYHSSDYHGELRAALHPAPTAIPRPTRSHCPVLLNAAGGRRGRPVGLIRPRSTGRVGLLPAGRPRAAPSPMASAAGESTIVCDEVIGRRRLDCSSFIVSSLISSSPVFCVAQRDSWFVSHPEAMCSVLRLFN